jgi:hypothetical protein
MKNILRGAARWSLLATLNAHLVTAHAQGTAFTYQGRLDGSGSPLSGLYDFRFKLYADPLGNTQFGANYFSTNLPVDGGLFVTTIDFGAGLFNGSNYWLEVDVRTNNPANSQPYTQLTPFHALLPTPYAVFANTARDTKLLQCPRHRRFLHRHRRGQRQRSGHGRNLSRPGRHYLGRRVRPERQKGLCAGGLSGRAGQARHRAGSTVAL